jgi:ornithine carbamoyltransferase
MAVKHLLSVRELGPENLASLVDRSLMIARGDGVNKLTLAGKIIGIYFRGSSTRTRTAFSAGAINLGASIISYGPSDLQIVTGETVQDTARVLSNFLDALVVRTNDSIEEMRAMTVQNKMAIINAMSEGEHPTQSIADLVTIKEAFGRLDNIHVLYLGEGNNTAAALALAVAQTRGMRLTLATPEGYGLSESLMLAATALAAQSGASVEQRHSLDNLPRDIDVVYTARWQTMGTPKSDGNWQSKFQPYKVTTELMGRVSKSSKTIFLHDLPAVRGGDVDDDVLDGPQSRAFRQAYHKMTSAMSVLEWCTSSGSFLTLTKAKTLVARSPSAVPASW